MKCLDVVKEDMQEVGVREDEVFGCGEGGHAGGRSEEHGKFDQMVRRIRYGEPIFNGHHIPCYFKLTTCDQRSLINGVVLAVVQIGPSKLTADWLITYRERRGSR